MQCDIYHFKIRRYRRCCTMRYDLRVAAEKKTSFRGAVTTGRKTDLVERLVIQILVEVIVFN